MRHVFLINPAAGKHQAAMQLIPQIEAFFQARGEEYKICVTQQPGHATQMARQEAEAGGPVRLYACGGDGTLLETMEGIIGKSNAQITHYPCGSANDYVRMFPCHEAFSDLEQLADGVCVPADGILCNGRLALNICSMGMDADVANRMSRYKRWPLVSGPTAYRLGVVETFFHKFGRDLHVTMHTADGVVERQGRYLFALAASGQYYGGGYRGAPQASPFDGLLDFVLIDVIGRLQVPGFLKRYRAGEHIGTPGCQFFRGTRMEITSAGPAVVNVDGECQTAEHIVFEVLPGAVPFVLPGASVPAREISA